MPLEPKRGRQTLREAKHQRLCISLALTLAFAAALPVNLTAQEPATPVALELILAIDSSSSIDPEQFNLQIAGFAEAFRHPDVVNAILSHRPNGIAVTLVQWSASFQQTQTVAWTHISDAESASRFAGEVQSNMRQFTGFGTATGSAITFSARLFGTGGYLGARRVIDIVSDERANTGTHPSVTRRRAADAGATINGLAIQERDKSLAEYFEEHVVIGPDAFVEVVNDYGDLIDAIRRKLLSEIRGYIATLGTPQYAAAFEGPIASRDVRNAYSTAR